MQSFPAVQDLLLTASKWHTVVATSNCYDALNSLKALESLFPPRNGFFHFLLEQHLLNCRCSKYGYKLSVPCPLGDVSAQWLAACEFLDFCLGVGEDQTTLTTLVLAIYCSIINDVKSELA